MDKDEGLEIVIGSWKIYTVVLYDSNTIRFCDS